MRIEHGDMREILARLIADKTPVHAIVTDPPYHLQSIVKRFAKSPRTEASMPTAGPYERQSRGFMGKMWDGGDIAFQSGPWRLCWELLPPGGHLIAFGGTRTYHRLATAIEEAGFEIRDTIAWLYGSGFPKSHNVSKGIDRAAGAERTLTKPGTVPRNGYGEDWDTGSSESRPRYDEPATDAARQWEGWGTALKPALEPICLARKPLSGTVAGNVLKHGTGALNIDGCRVGLSEGDDPRLGGEGDWATAKMAKSAYGKFAGERTGSSPLGRWPANCVHDGSDEVVSAFPDQTSGGTPPSSPRHKTLNTYGAFGGQENPEGIGSTSGNASRFFYSAKADADDRLGSKHPTVKPVDLMRWLVRLITPPGGTVLDPFAGSGATGMACMAEGFDCILVEREAEYVADIKRRLAHVRGADTPLFKTEVT